MSQQQQQQNIQQQQPQSLQPSSNGQLKADVPDPEVAPQVHHRRFSAAYKQRILAEADRCIHPGEVGALLRREGLYSSHLTRWRQQLQADQLDRLQPRKRGRKADPHAGEVARLQRENERLKTHLERAELIIEAQKKLCQLLNLPTYEDNEPK
jgi:transposase-like protein